MSKLSLPSVALVVAMSACSCGPQQQTSDAPAPAEGHARPVAAQDLPERVEVPAPPFTEGMFPCSACHAGLTVNRTRRALSDMHAEIVLQHDEEHRWCLDCHDANDRDSLHLAGGELVPFEASYVLCGQCHGEKLRDWKAGVHGRRSGQWNAHKTYLLCAHCHDPHKPRFAAIAPKPAPQRPVAPAWWD